MPSNWACFQSSSGDTDIKNIRVSSAGKGEGGMNWENSIETCTSPCVNLDGQWKFAVWYRELKFIVLWQPGGVGRWGVARGTRHVYTDSVSSVQFSHSVVSDSLRPHESKHARPPCPSPTPGVYSNSCPLSWWCHPTISSSITPFSSCPQSLPASGSFPMSQLFAWGGQSTGVSASASVLPLNTQDWSPLGWTGWISLQFKGLSRVFSNTTVQKHQFFGTQLSS